MFQPTESTYWGAGPRPPAGHARKTVEPIPKRAIIRAVFPIALKLNTGSPLEPARRFEDENREFAPGGFDGFPRFRKLSRW
jgi:hypothetical protein